MRCILRVDRLVASLDALSGATECSLLRSFSLVGSASVFSTTRLSQRWSPGCSGSCCVQCFIELVVDTGVFFPGRVRV